MLKKLMVGNNTVLKYNNNVLYTKDNKKRSFSSEPKPGDIKQTKGRFYIYTEQYKWICITQVKYIELGGDVDYSIIPPKKPRPSTIKTRGIPVIVATDDGDKILEIYSSESELFLPQDFFLKSGISPDKSLFRKNKEHILLVSVCLRENIPMPSGVPYTVKPRPQLRVLPAENIDKLECVVPTELKESIGSGLKAAFESDPWLSFYRPEIEESLLGLGEYFGEKIALEELANLDPVNLFGVYIFSGFKGNTFYIYIGHTTSGEFRFSSHYQDFTDLTILHWFSPIDTIGEDHIKGELLWLEKYLLVEFSKRLNLKQESTGLFEITVDQLNDLLDSILELSETKRYLEHFKKTDNTDGYQFALDLLYTNM